MKHREKVTMAIKATPDLNSAIDEMSAQQIKALISYAEGKLKEKIDGAKQALIAEMKSKAGELGLSYGDLFQSTPIESKQSRKRGVVPIKYRGPGENETWSGRGRPPRWLQALIDTGHSKDEFAI